MTLRSKVINGVKWTTFGAIYTSAIQILQLAILARILSPSDFGLMAIVMLIIGFSNMFMDMGVSKAIVFKQDVTKKQLTSLYWFNIFVGVVLFIIVLLVSPYVANFYESPQLIRLTALVSTTFLIQPFGQQFIILLQKNLQFNTITKVQVFSKTCSFILVVLLAKLGFGVLSLAYGIVAYSIISTAIFFYTGLSIYKPKFYFRLSDLDEFYSFGLYQMGEKTISYFAGQFDAILIGRLLSIETLGIYNIAKSIVSRPANIINPIITKVTFPVMSKINREDNKLKDVFVKTLEYITLFNAPIYALIALMARPIITVMFGHGWHDAIQIVQILSLGYLFSSIGNPSGALLLSKGKANIAFYWNLITFILYPVFIIYGSTYGINGIAVSFLGLHLLFIYPNWKYIVRRVIDVCFYDYLLSFVPYILISSLMYLLFYFILKILQTKSDITMILVSVLFVLFYMGIIFLVKGKLWIESLLPSIARYKR